MLTRPPVQLGIKPQLLTSDHDRSVVNHYKQAAICGTSTTMVRCTDNAKVEQKAGQLRLPVIHVNYMAD